MLLSEMAEELKEQGFVEVPTSKLIYDIYDYYIGSDNIAQFPKYHRYLMASDGLKGTSVFLNLKAEYIQNVEIVLPDEIQNMYWDAVKKLEEVTEIHYDSRYSTNFSDYASSCSKLYDVLHSAFSTLLDNSGITPANESIDQVYKDLELDLCLLDHPSTEVIFGDNYVLCLKSKNNTFLKEKEFYLDFISMLPEKMQRFDQRRGYWTELVESVCDSARNMKQFYERVGHKWYRHIDTDEVIDNLKRLGNSMTEQNSDLVYFAEQIAEQLGLEKYDDIEHTVMDGKINTKRFYRAAEEALNLMTKSGDYPFEQSGDSHSQDTLNQHKLQEMIPEIAKYVAEIEFSLGVKNVQLCAN
ncbi:MAG: hypothetical protein V1718_03890 [archaeon]